MNIMLWLAAGALLGWVGLKFMNANNGRGMALSVMIGMAGGFVGGSMLAPMFGDNPGNPDAFSPFALFLALICATAFLTISNMLARRAGI